MSETTSLPAAVVADTILRTVELGLTITDAAVDGDATVVFCNLLDDGRHFPGCGVEGIYRDTVIRRVTDVPVVGHPLRLPKRVPRYRCRTVECDRDRSFPRSGRGRGDGRVRRKHCRHSLQTDNGIADRGQALGNLGGIKPGVTYSDHAWVSLREHLDRYDQDYLQTWAAAFDASPDPDPRRRIDIEGAAQRITAHLIDAGMHKSSVYAWLRTIRDDATARPSLGDFLREADDRLRKPPKRYTFCVPVQSFPRFDGSAPPPGWLTARQTTEWKALYGAKAPGVSQQGSFLIEVSAHDINTAADRARTRISNLATKLHLGAKKPIILNPSMWSKDKGNEFPAHATNRVINVHAFERLGHLHDLDTVDYITNTLALVQAVRTGPPHVAVVNGWAAIESLMVGPADEQDVIAARRRFALIVAASMLRAELSWLSRSYALTTADRPRMRCVNAAKSGPPSFFSGISTAIPR